MIDFVYLIICNMLFFTKTYPYDSYRWRRKQNFVMFFCLVSKLRLVLTQTQKVARFGWTVSTSGLTLKWAATLLLSQSPKTTHLQKSCRFEKFRKIKAIFWFLLESIRLMVTRKPLGWINMVSVDPFETLFNPFAQCVPGTLTKRRNCELS